MCNPRRRRPFPDGKGDFHDKATAADCHRAGFRRDDVKQDLIEQHTLLWILINGGAEDISYTGEARDAGCPVRPVRKSSSWPLTRDG